LPQDVFAGDVLLLNDGQISLQVESIDGPRINTRVLVGGELGNNKGINRQGGGLSAGALTDKDREDIRTAAALKVDYLAVSFARDAADMNEARALIREAGGHALTVAKIERAEAIKNLANIVRASDAVMVARGDLGVEMGYAELAGLQKQIIQEARHQNRVVITATQMMESTPPRWSRPWRRSSSAPKSTRWRMCASDCATAAISSVPTRRSRRPSCIRRIT
jgi:pyruvate kinase